VLVQFDPRKKSSLVLNSLIKPERTSHTFCFENILPEADVFVSYNYLLTFLLSPSRETKEPNVLESSPVNIHFFQFFYGEYY
jgi:hypothetical protein